MQLLAWYHCLDFDIWTIQNWNCSSFSIWTTISNVAERNLFSVRLFLWSLGNGLQTDTDNVSSNVHQNIKITYGSTKLWSHEQILYLSQLWYYIHRYPYLVMCSKVFSNLVFGSFWLIFLCTTVHSPLVIICHRASPKTGAQAKMFLSQSNSGFMG